jgi:hypothetical protein
MHAKGKITVRSHKQSFTPYPSLSPYRQMDGKTDRGTNTLAARGLEELFFQLCCCVSFLFWREMGFWFYIFTYVTTQKFLRTNIFLIVVEVLAMFFGGFLHRSKTTTGKKRYSCLAVGWNKSKITICRVKIQTPPITL